MISSRSLGDGSKSWGTTSLNRAQPTLVKALQQLTNFQQITATADNHRMPPTLPTTDTCRQMQLPGRMQYN